MTAKSRITEKAAEILSSEPEGLHHSELQSRLSVALPNIPLNTIRGTLVGLVEHASGRIYKPARGVFRHVKYSEPMDAEGKQLGGAAQVREKDFYAGFADFLTEDVEECTTAVSLGGCIFQDKWGTPDVIGIRRPRETDVIKFPTEIVTAEIKTDTRGLITAFGQACSYRLFSHRCYLVVPRSAPTEDLARLEGLCIAIGLGLVLFDAQDATAPRFTIRVRAARNEPDPFYTNRNLKLIEDRLFR